MISPIRNLTNTTITMILASSTNHTLLYLAHYTSVINLGDKSELIICLDVI